MAAKFGRLYRPLIRARASFRHGLGPSLAAATALVSLTLHGDDGSPALTADNRKLEDFYEIADNRPLGMGGFGVVSPGVHRETGETVAIKSVPKKGTTRERMLREAHIMRLCGDHRCIVDFVDLFESASHWYLVMEMASGGELFDRLVTKGPYTEATAAELLGEVAEALAYMHQQGCVHLDLKPENILLHTENSGGGGGGGSGANGGGSSGGGGAGAGGGNGQDGSSGRQETTRLTDFGSAFIMSGEGRKAAAKVGSGTSAYLPPEALRRTVAARGGGKGGSKGGGKGGGKGDDGAVIGAAADVWALGVVLYILLAGAHPFDLDNDATDAEIERRIVQDEVVLQGGGWDSVSAEAKDLLRALLDKDPDQRPSAHQLLNHPWMQGAASAHKVPLEEAAENLRRFHRGRRRLKALLLATMLGLDRTRTRTRHAVASPVATQRPQPHALSHSSGQGGQGGQGSPRLPPPPPPSPAGQGEEDAASSVCGPGAKHEYGAWAGEERLGSRNCALRTVFDPAGKGEISADDLRRVVARVAPGEEPLDDAEIHEMLRAADQNPRTTQAAIRPEQMLRLVPPLCPAQKFEPNGIVFKTGEIDPQCYLVTKGEVELSYQPKRGAAPIVARSVGRGGLVGADSLLLSDGTVQPRLFTARCVPATAAAGGKGGGSEGSGGGGEGSESGGGEGGDCGCHLLAVGPELFSHLTDVFGSLGSSLTARARAHMGHTLHSWVDHAKANGRAANVALRVVDTPLASGGGPGSGGGGGPGGQGPGATAGGSGDGGVAAAGGGGGVVRAGTALWPLPPLSMGGGVDKGPVCLSAQRSGCLLVLERGELQVDMEAAAHVPEGKAAGAAGMGGGAGHRARGRGAGPGGGGGGGGGGSVSTSPPPSPRVETRRVGPGFVAYCAPPRPGPSSSSSSSSSLASRLTGFAAGYGGLGGGAASSPSSAATSSLSDKHVPVGLRRLPRCVAVRAVAPQHTAGTGEEGSAGSAGVGRGDRDGGDGEGGDVRVSFVLVNGADLHDLMRQPGMAPLRAYLADLATEPPTNNNNRLTTAEAATPCEAAARNGGHAASEASAEVSAEAAASSSSSSWSRFRR